VDRKDWRLRARPIDNVERQLTKSDQPVIGRDTASRRVRFEAPDQRERWLYAQLLPQGSLVSLIGGCGGLPTAQDLIRLDEQCPSSW